MGNGDASTWGIEQFTDDEPTSDSIVALQEEYQRLLQILPDERMRRIVAMRLEGYTVKSIAQDFGYTTRWAERKLKLIREFWLRDLQ
jgi:DNA-directed RNA polymerase specialized sigma24 family protein